MRIAFVGKGGSGKTTLCSLFCLYLTQKEKKIFAIDADINQHLGDALNIPPIPHYLGHEINKIKSYVQGKNQRIIKSGSFIKTTPPGIGSKFVQCNFHDPLLHDFISYKNGIHFMGVGDLEDHDIGAHCYHAKTGAVEILLNHLIDFEDEYVVLDMTAGADAFSSGLFAKFDIAFFVVEPTKKACDVYDQYMRYAREFNILVIPIGNKIRTEKDKKYIEDSIKSKDIITFAYDENIYQQEQSKIKNPSLSESISQNLEKMYEKTKKIKRDWNKMYEVSKLFHIKNAERWANKEYQHDLKDQIDPSFDILSILKEKSKMDSS